MNRRLFLASGSVAVLAATAPAAALVPRKSLRELLSTRAESSDYARTSSYADLQEFLAALDRRGAPIVRGVLAKSQEGREIPYVIASRPRVRSVAEARALGRAIVLVVANVRGNDVDGKEAVLEVLRDLCLSTEKTLLDDIVLVIVPSLDPDGNERLAAQPTDSDENGPVSIGTRENAQGLDLQVDFVRVDAPETRGLVDFIRVWKPDVFIDLQTSGKSFDAFNLTHAPSLHPAAFYGGVYARDRMLPAIHDELHAKFAVETFVAGDFGRSKPLPGPGPATDTYNFGWFAPDYRPRSAVNYMGMRGSVAVVARSYAHDPLERRIFSTRAFVESALGYASEHDDDIAGVATTATRWLGGPIPLRATFPAKPTSKQTISWENLAFSSEDRQPGVPSGYKRTGTFSSATLPVYDRFVGTRYVRQPKAYVIPYEHAALVKPLLDVHGIYHETLVAQRKMRVMDYVVDRIERSQERVGKHALTELSGHWRPQITYVAKFGALVVPAFQTLGPLLSLFLEPESDDGFFAWNVFDSALRVGYSTPVLRVM